MRLDEPPPTSMMRPESGMPEERMRERERVGAVWNQLSWSEGLDS